jgi:hypothetical protein
MPDPQDLDLEEVEMEEMEEATGWKTSAAALAGAARLVRLGVWAALLAGPLLGGAALLGGTGSAVADRPVTVTVAATASGTGPSGFAQLYIRAYLAAGNGTESSLAPYYAGTVSLANPPHARSAAATVALGSTEVSPGYWPVTVAADVVAQPAGRAAVDEGLHYYQVGVEALGSPSAGGARAGARPAGYTATSLPAEVAAPAALQPGALVYGTATLSDSDPAQAVVGGFLSAYLAGTGELGPYTSPGVVLSPIAPAAYTSVTVTGVSDDAPDGTGGTTVPADGTQRRVLAQVDATDSTGTYALTYALTLRARAGRWEVDSLDPAPRLAAASTAALPSSTSTAGAAPVSAKPTVP